MRLLLLLAVAVLATLGARVAMVEPAGAAADDPAAEAAPELTAELAAAPELAPAPASQPVVTTLEIEHYAVDGTTARAVLDDMSTRGPQIHGRVRFGVTRSQTSLRYRATPTAAGCRLADVRVDLGVTLTLPHWRDAAQADYGLQRDWARFAAALRRHEDGHRELAQDGATETYERLRALRTPTCDAIDAEARRIAREVDAATQRRQQRYDDRTGHGRTQGARWPLR